MNRREMEDLLAQAMDSEADASSRAELARALRENPEWLDWARGQMAIHGALAVLMEDEVSRERMVQRQIQALDEADGPRFAAVIRGRLSKARLLTRVAAAVALLAAAGALLLMKRGTDAPRAMVVATLSRTENVEWDTTAGNVLHAGDSLKIRKGLLELDLAGKGRLIVEGPAEVGFPNDSTAILHRGRVVMRATPRGAGYRIETSQGALVDLGTEFGVRVSDTGVVESQVLSGHIEAYPKGGGRLALAANEAVRMDASGGAKIDSSLGAFYTELPPKTSGGMDYIHWSFNEGRGDVAAAKGKLAEGIPEKGAMKLFGKSDYWKPGPMGSSLDLDGKSVFGETHYRGIRESDSRSVCFWLRVPEKFDPKEGLGIVSWGLPGKEGETWQISANPLSADGPIGRIRVGLFGGQVVGSTDLRDDRWHHVAVVLYGGSLPDVGTHVLLYIDGKPEQISNRALQEVRTQTDAAEHGVWVGRNVWYSRNLRFRPASPYFRGGIDELYIFNAALNADEIHRLMGNGPS